MARLNTAAWRNFDVTIPSLEGATFSIRPVDACGDMTIIAIMNAIAEHGANNLLALPAQWRRELVDFTLGQLISWSGIEDEYGRELPFDADAARRYLPGGKVFALFFAIGEAVQANGKDESAPKEDPDGR